MTWIDIAWPMMVAASLTLGLIHLRIWFRQRTQPAQLMFSLAAMCVGTLAAVELLAMRAETPPQYATMVRWTQPIFASLFVLLVLFVRERFHAGRPWLAVAACTLRLASLLPNFLTGANLHFRNIVELARPEFPGNAVPAGDPNPWMVLALLSDLLLVIFLLDAMVTAWRHGNADQRRPAILVCGSMAVFVFFFGAWTALVVLGAVQGPLTVTVAFFAMLLVMSHELGGDAMIALQLAQQLADSESKLRVSEQRMRLAAQAAELGMWTWDLETNETWFTETGNALLGLEPGALLGLERFLERVHPEDRTAVLRAQDVAPGGEYACEYRLLQPDGGVRWIAAKGRVDHARPGTHRLIRGMILDVTAWRQAEERFRLVVDGAPIAMLMVDGDGRIALANAQAESVFGYSRAELLGQCIDMLVPKHPRERHAGNRAKFAANPQARAMGMRRHLFGRRKDGSKIPVEIDLNPILVADTLYVLASIVDISERLRIEREAAVQRDELAHLSRVALLGEISGSLAHELNQPLTAILSNAQAALRFLGRESPDLGEVRESLVRIVEIDKRASEVIRRLRAMLRKEHINHQELEINEIVEDVLRLINSDVANRNVTVILELASDLPTIRGDRIQLQQVLLNLVINACDAMDEMGAGRTLTVRTRCAPGPAIEVSVSDTGCGIPPENLERIFTPFVTSKTEGMGIGLAVCRALIRAHGGNLWATNNPSRGATLHFVLPSAHADPPDPA